MLLLQALLHASLLGLAFADNTINVVPLPTNVTVGSTVTCLSDDFRVVLGQNPPRDLKDAAARMISRIRKSQHRYLSVEYGAEFFQSKPGDHGHSNHVKCSDHVSELHLRFTDSGSIAWHATRAVEVRTSDVERYTLSVPANGRAVATGTTALGMFRALTTFENLWYKIGNDGSVDLDDSAGGLQTGSGGIAYAPFAPYDIRDEPLFPWRSVMLDTSRHFFHKATLLRLLDTMAKVKLSVFHWHLTDSQTWPLELSQFPELAHKGSYQKRWYTESDVKEVIAYAAARGIDVVVEIDTPGHSQSIGKSHPEYITCVGNWGTRGQLRWADPAVVDWTSKVLLAAASITQSKYFGTGGDEVRIPCMEADVEMQRLLRERNMTLEESFSNFTLTNNNNLIKAGHSPVVWEEIIVDHNVPLDKATIVNAWVNYTSTQEVADKGYRFVHAWSDYFYLVSGVLPWSDCRTAGRAYGLGIMAAHRAGAIRSSRGSVYTRE